jgi:hypothetical protein
MTLSINLSGDEIVFVMAYRRGAFHITHSFSAGIAFLIDVTECGS